MSLRRVLITNMSHRDMEYTVKEDFYENESEGRDGTVTLMRIFPVVIRCDINTR